MTSEEITAMNNHTRALDEHSQVLRTFTGLLARIFEETNSITQETTVHSLHHIMNAFLEGVTQITNTGNRLVENTTEVAEKICRAAEVNEQSADKMYRASVVNEESAEKMSRAAYTNDEAASRMFNAAAYR